jgi:hypothetical protein
MKYCLYCGNTIEDFHQNGRLGCESCLDVFFEEIISYLKRRKIQLSQAPNFSLEAFEKGFIYASGLDESELLSLFTYIGLSVRYRVGRNLSKEPFIVPKTGISERLYKKIYAVLDHKDLVGFSLYMGDEEHFRIEKFCETEIPIKEIEDRFDLNSIELFSYRDGYGFISACPSNFGFGNKLSIRLNVTKLVQKRILPSRILPGWIEQKQTLEDMSAGTLLFYCKNINQEQATIFLRYMYAIHNLTCS